MDGYNRIWVIDEETIRCDQNGDEGEAKVWFNENNFNLDEMKNQVYKLVENHEDTDIEVDYGDWGLE
jgi:hypothetical protein